MSFFDHPVSEAALTFRKDSGTSTNPELAG